MPIEQSNTPKSRALGYESLSGVPTKNKLTQILLECDESGIEPWFFGTEAYHLITQMGFPGYTALRLIYSGSVDVYMTIDENYQLVNENGDIEEATVLNHEGCWVIDGIPKASLISLMSEGF